MGYALPCAVLAILLSITYLSWQAAQQDAYQYLKSEFDVRVQEAVNRTQQRIQAYEQVLRSATGMLATHEQLSHSNFHAYVALLKLETNYPGIQGLGFLPLVASDEKARHIAAMRQEGFPSYAIQPDGERDFYAPIDYLEQYSGRTPPAYGMDMYFDLARRTSMEQARDLDSGVISGKFQLASGTGPDAQAGFLMNMPVYKNGMPHATLAERRANIRGWISAAFRMDELMNGILDDLAPSMDIEVYDGDKVAAPALMHDSDKSTVAGHAPTLFQASRTLQIAGHSWTVLIRSLSPFDARLDSQTPRLVAILGVALSLLLALLTWLLVYGRARAQQATAALQRENRSNETLLRTASDGIHILDLDGNVVQVNNAFCHMLGYTQQELLSMNVAQWDEQWPADELKGSIATMMHNNSVFDTRQRRSDGSIIDVEINVVGVEIEGRQLLYCSARNNTERKRTEAELQLAATVYQNSSEAMLITDAKNRIIAINPAFTQVTGYTAAEAKGKNPRLLKSSLQDKAFYHAMWHAINTAGHWQGEIWNRRKNGEVYAESLRINVIRNADGMIYQHVALFSDITEKKKSEELIWQQANFDTLTELPNRRMFRDRLAQEIKKAQRASQPLALLLIDLDRFKEVNDTLGHNIGDMLLREAARRIGDCVRATDMVARLGGDEFAVVMSGLRVFDSVERVVQGILRKLAEPYALEKEVVYVSASIGVTLYPDDANEMEGLLKNADQAMYVAKNEGRDRHSYFTPKLQQAALARLRLINDLRGALDAGQFILHFQPVVDMVTGHINKAEALLRWQHPQRGLVLPAEFIPLTEETGLILKIGDWVFKESARLVKHLRTVYDPDFQICINTSPVQFNKNGKEHATWLAHLHSMDLPAKCIIIEITEGLLLDAGPAVTNALLAFRDAGVQVAIDDFGTGYSSLSYLKKFDIDYLKIDQSFTRNLAPGSSDMALSEAIIVMAHKLGLKVVAEGVETGEQQALLAAAGCDYAQGHLFSHAVAIAELEILLQDELQKHKPIPILHGNARMT